MTTGAGIWKSSISDSAEDKAYIAHHFNCATCIAAGLRSGNRCDTGLALWAAYQEIST